MFKVMFGFQLPCYFPEDVIAPDKGFGVEEDLAILKEGEEADDDENTEEDSDDDTEVSSDDGNEEDKEEDIDDDSEEDADEKKKKKDTEEDDEEEEDSETDDEIKVTVKGIKKDFPDFFKKHPEMKGVIFREKQYSEIYANPAQAQSAAKLANQWNNMEADLLAGDTEPLFKALKQTKGYAGFATNLLPNLRKVDADTYYKIIEVPLRQMLRKAYKDGTSKNDKNLANSAAWLHQFLFDNTDFNEKADFEKEAKSEQKSEKEKLYEQKLQDYDRRDYTNYKTSVDEDWARGVEKFFMDGLDPDNVLSDKTKTWMLRDLYEELNDQMGKDTRYQRGITDIWVQAKNSGYNPSFKTRIVSTSLARAKQIIPAIRQKLRAEALNEKRRIVKSKGREPEKKTVIHNRVVNKNRSDDRYKSDLDIIRGK